MQKNSGQAMISILFLLSIISFIIVQTTILNLGSVGLSNDYYQGSNLLIKTEGYLENSAIEFLRNPNYTGEDLPEGNISCTMRVVATDGQKDITATCTQNEFQKTAGMTVLINKGVYTFSKIQER